MANAQIRNVNEITTGDFVDFEVLAGSQWRQAQLSGTAVRILWKDGQTDRQVVEANADRVVAAAIRLAGTTPSPAKIAISSDDL